MESKQAYPFPFKLELQDGLVKQLNNNKTKPLTSVILLLKMYQPICCNFLLNFTFPLIYQILFSPQALFAVLALPAI